MRPVNLEDRTTYLGCSDLAPLLSLSPWRTREQLLLEKTGRLAPQPQTVAMRLGQLLEDDVLTLLEEALPELERRETNLRVSHPTLPWFGAQCDAIHRRSGSRILAECKTTGFLSKDWGVPGTDEIPGYYMAQVQGQLECLGGSCESALVPLLILSRRELRIYEVTRDVEMGRQIAVTAQQFWNEIEDYWAQELAA